MAPTPDKNPSSWLQTLQQISELNITELAVWVIPALVASWVWVGKWKPPLHWIGSVCAGVGISHAWAHTAGAWLHARPALFPIYVLAAVVSAGASSRQHPGSRLTLTLLLLIAAASSRSPAIAAIRFAEYSGGLCLAAISVSALIRKGDVRESLTAWLLGPGIALSVAFWLPPLALWFLVEPYIVREP